MDCTTEVKRILSDVWTLLSSLQAIRLLFFKHIQWRLIEIYNFVEIQGYETAYYDTIIHVCAV